MKFIILRHARGLYPGVHLSPEGKEDARLAGQSWGEYLRQELASNIVKINWLQEDHITGRRMQTAELMAKEMALQASELSKSDPRYIIDYLKKEVEAADPVSTRIIVVSNEEMGHLGGEICALLKVYCGIAMSGAENLSGLILEVDPETYPHSKFMESWKHVRTITPVFWNQGQKELAIGAPYVQENNEFVQERREMWQENTVIVPGARLPALAP